MTYVIEENLNRFGHNPSRPQRVKQQDHLGRYNEVEPKEHHDPPHLTHLSLGPLYFPLRRISIIREG